MGKKAVCWLSLEFMKRHLMKGGVDMTKAEFVDKLAEKGKITKKQAIGSYKPDFRHHGRRVGRW